MSSISDLIKKEDEILQKAKDLHKVRTTRLKDSQRKKIMKALDQVNYFKLGFSDDEFINGLNHLIHLKNTKSPILISGNPSNGSDSV